MCVYIYDFFLFSGEKKSFEIKLKSFHYSKTFQIIFISFNSSINSLSLALFWPVLNEKKVILKWKKWKVRSSIWKTWKENVTFFFSFPPPRMSALAIKPVTWAPHEPRSSLSSVTAYCQPSVRSVRRKDTWDPIPSRRTSRTTLRKHSTQLFPFTSLWPSQSQHNQRLRINNSVFLTVKELAVVCRSLRVPSQACKKGFLHHMGHSCLKIGPSEILKLLWDSFRESFSVSVH